MTRIEVPNRSLRRSSSGRGIRILVLVVLLGALGFAGWTWLTLAWAYSEGERGGVLQKFSRSGWLCKTDEGELALYIVSGIAPQIWYFSVRDAATGARLREAVGHKVQLHYTEHPGVPSSCFGNTRYFVDQVLVEDNPQNEAPAAPAGTATQSPNPR
jgi:hypothetical protein